MSLPAHQPTSLPAHQLKSLILIPPVGYLDMLILEQNARTILTDSGGMQKEAYFFGVPCVTLRSETEWVETVGTGWNVVVGADKQKIINAVRSFNKTKSPRPKMYGNGEAAEKIIQCLTAYELNNLRANQLKDSGVTLTK
ncbi:MAG: UDP-N-acetylglucosamine 2-epimerase [Nitrospinales bacterium]